MIGGGDPFYLKFWIKVTALERNRIVGFFARSDSAVTPSEKTSINTNRKYALSNEPNMNVVRCP